ncbi:hypothetical protein ACWCQQ_50015 [Streptomyces sp. NPDC002143]
MSTRSRRPGSRTPPWGCPYAQRDGERNPEVDSGAPGWTGTDRTGMK